MPDCPICLNKTARIEQLEDRNVALHNEVVELQKTLAVATQSVSDLAGARDRALANIAEARGERADLQARNAKLLKLAAEAKLGAKLGVKAFGPGTVRVGDGEPIPIVGGTVAEGAE